MCIEDLLAAYSNLCRNVIFTKYLAKGAFSCVYEALDGDVPCVVKFSALGVVESRGVQMEIEALPKFVKHCNGHPRFAYCSYFNVNLKGHLVSQWELGEKSLEEYLQECLGRCARGIPAEELLRYMQHAAEGIDFLKSKSFVHRDIKPDNLLLFRGNVKLIDFGFARTVSVDSVATSIVGTPMYSPPELSPDPVTGDIYSLAASYVRLRTGEFPFHSDNDVDDNSHELKAKGDFLYPQWMVGSSELDVLKRALAIREKRDFKTATDFVSALDGAIRCDSVQPPPVPPPPPKPPTGQEIGNQSHLPWKTRQTVQFDVKGRFAGFIKTVEGIIPNEYNRPSLPPLGSASWIGSENRKVPGSTDLTIWKLCYYGPDKPWVFGVRIPFADQINGLAVNPAWDRMFYVPPNYHVGFYGFQVGDDAGVIDSAEALNKIRSMIGKIPASPVRPTPTPPKQPVEGWRKYINREVFVVGKGRNNSRFVPHVDPMGPYFTESEMAPNNNLQPLVSYRDPPPRPQPNTIYVLEPPAGQHMPVDNNAGRRQTPPRPPVKVMLRNAPNALGENTCRVIEVDGNGNPTHGDAHFLVFIHHLRYPGYPAG